MHVFGVNIIVIIIHMLGDVARLFRTFEFVLIFLDDFFLNHFPALGVYGVSDIGVHFLVFNGISGVVGGDAIAAFVTEFGAQMIFGAARAATVRNFSGGHGDKITVDAVDDFQVPDDEITVKSYGAKSLQPVMAIFNEFDSNLRNLHGVPPENFLNDQESSRFRIGRNLAFSIVPTIQ